MSENDEKMKAMVQEAVTKQLEERSNVADTGNSMNQSVVNALINGMKTLSQKSIPTWDSSMKGVSIKSHIKQLEYLAESMDWDKKRKGMELYASLVGNARKFAEALDTTEMKDYDKLKESIFKLDPEPIRSWFLH